MAIRGCFVLGTARVKALGWLKKKERRKMTKLDFHHFQSSSLYRAILVPL